MVKLGEFKIELIVEGKPANEYDTDDDTAPDTNDSITTYVEAVSGKEFHFAIEMDPGYTWGNADVIRTKLWMDGERRTGVCLEKDWLLTHPRFVHTLVGEYSGTGSNAKIHRFTFADLQTRELIIPWITSPTYR